MTTPTAGVHRVVHRFVTKSLKDFRFHKPVSIISTQREHFDV